MQHAAAQPIAHEPEADMARIYRDHSARVLAAAYRVTGAYIDIARVDSLFLALLLVGGLAFLRRRAG